MIRKVKIVLLAALLMLFAAQGPAFALKFAGTIVEVDRAEKTFQVCPDIKDCGVTEKNVFQIHPYTKFEGFQDLGELKKGDRVEVYSEQRNIRLIWDALMLVRQ